MNPSSTSRHRGTRSARRSKPEPAAPRFTGKYLCLTTFRRDGTGVATPVWFVTEAGKIFIVTEAGSYKVRRIRRNPSVTVAECTASGRLRSAHVPARAQIIPPGETHRAEALMAGKYRLDRMLILPLYRAVQAIARGRRANSESVVLVITPGSL
jgi:PPOX class probable F420-dependent enzyme